MEWIFRAEDAILQEERVTEEQKQSIMESMCCLVLFLVTKIWHPIVLIDLFIARRRAETKKMKHAPQQSTETEEEEEEEEEDEQGTVICPFPFSPTSSRASEGKIELSIFLF